MSWRVEAGRFGLRWQLAASYALLALLATALLTGLAVRTASAVSLAAQRQHALASVSGVAVSFADALSTASTDPAQAARQQGLAADGRVLWLGPDGAVRVDGWGASELLGRPLGLPAGLVGAPQAAAGIYTSGTTWVAYAAAPLAVAGKAAGQVVLVRDLSAVQQELRQLQQRLWLVGGLLALLCAGAGLALAETMARPLERLTAAVRRMRSGDLRQAVAVGGSRESAVLAESFNEMTAQVAALDEQRRAFVANAAHELRTPLAALNALAEAEGLEAFARQTERMGRLVSSLLTLARLDNPELKLNRTPIRLPNLAQEARWIVRPLAAGRQVDLVTTGEEAEAWVSGDPDWLHQALVNVLDNAVRYTPEGGWVRLGVGVEGGMAVVRVQDSGPGVPPDALARLGTRFYRVSAARERATGGSGLGLAIVREIMRLHGGEVGFFSPPGEGLTVTITLPAIPPEPES